MPTIIQLPGYDVLLVPPQYVAEIARIPKEILGRAEEKRICSKYTKLGWRVSLAALAKTLRTNLNRHLEEVTPEICEELRLAVAQTIGSCEKPTPRSLGFELNDILSQVAARIFVGLPLSREPELVVKAMSTDRFSFADAYE